MIEAVVAALQPGAALEAEAAGHARCSTRQAACRLRLGGQLLGYVGQVRPEGLKQFDLRGADHRGRGEARRRWWQAADLVPRLRAAARPIRRSAAT